MHRHDYMLSAFAFYKHEMILNRLGNKKVIAADLIALFPPHDCYIEMFAGSGAVFFAKPRVAHNFLNDSDEQIFNLWEVVKFRSDELIAELEMLPISDKLWKSYKKFRSEDKVLQAALFLFYSNFGYMGKPDTLKLGLDSDKIQLIKNIKAVLYNIQDVKFLCCDFRDVLKKISFKNKDRDKQRSFIYADPPYLNSTHNYASGFIEMDTIDLFEILVNSGIRFAISEFQHPLVLELVKKHGLNVHIIGERRNMGNRRTEILITNYENNQLSIL